MANEDINNAVTPEQNIQDKEAREKACNTVTPEQDEEARKQACDPTRSYIVQAPAGSGKTSLLTLRFLNLLTTVEYPEQIIAITFTRKAAAEMRARILGELEAAEKKTEYDEGNAYKKNLREAAEKVLERNNKKDWHLTDQPNRLRISTIDSLCLQLSKQLPITSEFGAALMPTDNSSELYSEAAHRTIIELESLPEDNPLNESYRVIAELFNNETAKIEEYLAKLLETRENWLPLLDKGTNVNDSITASHKIVTDAMKTIRDILNEISKENDKNILEDLIDIGSRRQDKNNFKSPYLIKLNANNSILQDDISRDSIFAWCELCSILMKPDYEIRKDFRGAFIAEQDKTNVKNIWNYLKEIAPQQQDHLISSYKLLKTLADRLITSTKQIINLIPADNERRIINNIFTMLEPALAQLRAVFGEKKVCDYSEFSINARKALDILKTSETDLAEKLDYKIKHILIDEYQDTSEAQYELANLLTQGWVPCEDDPAKENNERTIFMVGDPMQSIYRFRNAEVGVYLRTKKEGLQSGQIKPEYLQLLKNFRSVNNTVSLFNDFFQNLFPTEDDEHEGAISYSQALSSKDCIEARDLDIYNSENVKYFCHNDEKKGLYLWDEGKGSIPPAYAVAVEDDDKAKANEKEAEIIRKIIRKELDENKNNNDFSIALLVRTRNAIASLIPYFEGVKEEDKIPFQAVEIYKLSTKAIISDLISLTKAILNPSDKIALLSLLRSPWCGLTLKELKTITNANPLDMPDIENLDTIGKEVRPRVALLRDTLQASYSARSHMSLRNLTEAAWIKLGGPTICTETDLKQAELYFSTLAKLENEKTLISPDDIDKAIKDLYALPDISDEAKKVQIMTIHKAKGLEFDTVILPGITRKGKNNDYSLISFLKTKSAQLIGLNPKEPQAKNIAQCFIETIEKKKEGNELKRLLYVALTRAKKHIWITGQKTDIKSNTSIWSCFCSAYPESKFEKFFKKSKKDKNEEPDEEATDAKRPPLDDLKYIAGWDLGHNPAPAPPEALILEQIEPSDWQEKWTEKITDQKTDTAISVGEVPYLGTVVHNFFRIIAEEGLDNWNNKRLDDCKTAIINSLISLGTNPAIANEHAEHVLKVLKDSLESERARWILGAHEQAACEMRITGPLGDNEDLIDETKDNDKNRIIDRTFVENGIRWIIDYKTGQRKPGESAEDFAQRKLDGRIGNHQTYREQLDSYATLLKNAGEKLPIKLALYFPFTNSDKTSNDPKEMFIEWEPENTEFSD